MTEDRALELMETVDALRGGLDDLQMQIMDEVEKARELRECSRRSRQENIIPITSAGSDRWSSESRT